MKIPINPNIFNKLNSTSLLISKPTYAGREKTTVPANNKYPALSKPLSVYFRFNDAKTNNTIAWKKLT